MSIFTLFRFFILTFINVLYITHCYIFNQFIVISLFDTINFTWYDIFKMYLYKSINIICTIITYKNSVAIYSLYTYCTKVGNTYTDKWGAYDVLNAH